MASPTRGLFITFEGPEGSGKSTQLARAADYLAVQGRRVVATREPGGGPLADKIRAVLLDANHAALTPMAELCLYVAGRAQHVAERIRPALAESAIVLCDRFTDSTWAYQGYARGLGVELVEKLNDLATGGLTPDLTLLYDLPVELGLTRARQRADRLAPVEREDRFEREELAFHQRLREGYLLLAAKHPARFRVIDGAPNAGIVWEQTRAALDELLEKRR
jgi:dTMP kinase